MYVETFKVKKKTSQLTEKKLFASIVASWNNKTCIVFRINAG